MVERFTPEILETLTDGQIADQLFRMYAMDPLKTEQAYEDLLGEVERRGLDHQDLICALEDFRTNRSVR